MTLLQIQMQWEPVMQLPVLVHRYHHLGSVVSAGKCLQTRKEDEKKGGIAEAKQDHLGTFDWIPITYPLSSKVLLTHMCSSLFMTTEK